MQAFNIIKGLAQVRGHGGAIFRISENELIRESERACKHMVEKQIVCLTRAEWLEQSTRGSGRGRGGACFQKQARLCVVVFNPERKFVNFRADENGGEDASQ